jgi:hypothetical protein
MMWPVPPHRRRASRLLLALVLTAALAGAGCGRDRDVAAAPHVSTVKLSANQVVVELLDSARVSATVRMSDGSVAQQPVEWSCTREDLVRTCGPDIVPRDTGSFKLIARVGSVADTAAVRIYEQGMLEVVITEPSSSSDRWILEGRGLLVKLHVADSLGVSRKDRPIRWESSDSTVAVVRDTTWWDEKQGSYWPGGTVQSLTPGTAVLKVTVGRQQASMEVVVRPWPRARSCDTTMALSLDMAVGELRRYRGSDPDLPGCLQYRHSRDAGRRYLVMTERLPVASGAQLPGRRGIFLAGAAAADSVIVYVHTPQTSAAQLLAARTQGEAAALSSGGDRAEWHIGGVHAAELAGTNTAGVRAVWPAQTSGPRLQAAGAGAAAVAVGDTLVIDGLGGLGRAAGDSISDKAVIRYVGQNLVFAEHVDLFGPRLRRASGAVSGPIPMAEYPRIDAAYGPGQTQLDRLFGLPATDSVVLLPEGRELVLNTILPTGVWGTWRRNIAIIDYWYSSNGTNPGTLQDPLLLANQLIVHEMAHIRHLQHQPMPPTLLWSLEGIARFAEHLAFAAHLMGSQAPSRSGNFTAGAVGYPTAPQARTHIEMPTAAALSSNFLGGYSGAAHIFDYLADHVEAAGGDGLAAVREVLLGSHARASADAAVARALGEAVTLDELITRARLALVLDDFPTTANLPRWTQYLQYNLPASRPWTLDWPVGVPGAALALVRPIAEGRVWGFFIDGDRAFADQDFLLDVTRGGEAVLSIVRIQ